MTRMTYDEDYDSNDACNAVHDIRDLYPRISISFNIFTGALELYLSLHICLCLDLA